MSSRLFPWPEHDHSSDVGLAVVAVGTALVLALDALHASYMFAPVGVLLVVLAVPRLRAHPATWYLTALVWVPPLVVDWVLFEDHCYVAAYWALAVGLALHGPDPWPVLKHHARMLVGLMMGAAAIWKVATPAFRDGRLFELVLAQDTRFGPLLGRVASGVDEATWMEGARASHRVLFSPSLADSATWTSGSRSDLVVGFMVVWTIATEAGLAVSFLAPDEHWLSRVRAPLLLAFCWGLYPVVPILGFAVLLPLLGAVADYERPRVVQAYVVSVLCFIGLWLAGELHWQEHLADWLVG